MKFSKVLNAGFAIAGLAVISASVPTKSYAVEYNVCIYRAVPPTVLKRILVRPDIESILEEMFIICPEAALALTEAATAAIERPPLYQGDPNNDNPVPKKKKKPKKKPPVEEPEEECEDGECGEQPGGEQPGGEKPDHDGEKPGGEGGEQVGGDA